MIHIVALPVVAIIGFLSGYYLKKKKFLKNKKVQADHSNQHIYHCLEQLNCIKGQAQNCPHIRFYYSLEQIPLIECSEFQLNPDPQSTQTSHFYKKFNPYQPYVTKPPLNDCSYTRIVRSYADNLLSVAELQWQKSINPK